MARRLSWCVIPALLLAGCSYPDYGAVRDFAGTAADAALWPPVAERRAGQPARLARLRPGAALAPELSPAIAARRDAVLAMQAALDTWFTALATLAADGLVRRPENPLAAEAAKAAALDEPAGRAVGAIGELLVTATKGNWRAPQTAGAIRAADPAVQVLLRALSETVAGMAAEDAPEREAIVALYGPLEAETPDPAARQTIRDWRAQREAELAARAADRDAYCRVLARIAEGQAVLLERASRLSQAETARQVRAAEEALRRAAALLPRAPVVSGTYEIRYLI